jgi:hypothetical protein
MQTNDIPKDKVYVVQNVNNMTIKVFFNKEEANLYAEEVMKECGSQMTDKTELELIVEY